MEYHMILVGMSLLTLLTDDALHPDAKTWKGWVNLISFNIINIFSVCSTIVRLKAVGKKNVHQSKVL